MDMKELKDIALELMDALAAKKLGEVELELDNAKIKIKAAEPAPVIAAASGGAGGPPRGPGCGTRSGAGGSTRSGERRRGTGRGAASGRHAGQEPAGRHVLFFSVSGRTAVRAGRSAGEGGRYPLHHRGDEDHERDQGTVRRQGHPHYGAAGRYGGV